MSDSSLRLSSRAAFARPSCRPVLPNCPQFLIAELGAWKAGATVLPLNPLYTAGELASRCVRGSRVVVTLTPFYKRLKTSSAKRR